jgi:GxxExxY protein
LGFGFLEVVYTNALVLVLTQAGLRVESEVPFDIHFRGQLIGRYRPDVVVAGSVIVEVKSGRCLVQQHTTQLLNYLRGSKLKVGLILGFGEKPEFRRIVHTRNDPR